MPFPKGPFFLILLCFFTILKFLLKNKTCGHGRTLFPWFVLFVLSCWALLLKEKIPCGHGRTFCFMSLMIVDHFERLLFKEKAPEGMVGLLFHLKNVALQGEGDCFCWNCTQGSHVVPLCPLYTPHSIMLYPFKWSCIYCAHMWSVEKLRYETSFVT